MSKIEISQSLINLYQKYKYEVPPYKGYEVCGEFLRLVYITKEAETPSSIPMQMGQRFEYEALGNSDYHGNVPPPFFNLNGSLSAKQTMVTIQAGNFKNWMINEGNTILERGQRVYFELDDYKFSIMRDLVFQDSEGKRVNCDLKMSGNLGDKVSEWGWHEETIASHEYKLMQAIFYTLVDTYLGNQPDAFVFYVASSRDQNTFKAFKLHFKQETLNAWEKRIHEIAKEITFEHNVTGFTARPGAICAECPAKEICTKKDEKAAKSQYVHLTI